MKVRGFIDARSIGLVLIKDAGKKAFPLRGLKELQPIQKQISSLPIYRCILKPGLWVALGV